MTVRLLQGDCRDVTRQLIAEGVKVQTCITSPPYWGLRDYGVPPMHWPAVTFTPIAGLPPITVPAWDGCLGLEPDPWMFVGHMVEVFRLVRDALADDGTLWLNLGDCYITRPNGGVGENSTINSRRTQEAYREASSRHSKLKVNGLKPKDLAGIPWRVAFALQADGWYLRMDNIWHKINPMPESATDRPTKAHEYVFLFAKRERYYYDAEAIKEPVTGNAHSRGSGVNLKARNTGVGWGYSAAQDPNEKRNDRPRVKVPSGWDTSVGEGGHTGTHGRYRPRQNASFLAAVTDTVDMRNKRSVWTVATAPFPEAHFATFPPDLIKPCILAGTSERGHCQECGARWVRDLGDPIATGGRGSGNKARKPRPGAPESHHGAQAGSIPYVPSVLPTIGWRPTCNCGHEPVPDTAFDPFGGSGTTGLESDRLGRNAILAELKPEYVDMQQRRIQGDAPLFAEVQTA